MGKLTIYNFVSLNGYYKGGNEDISWAKSDSKGEQDFASEKLQSGNILIFGRVTYEMMASYWPTPDAAKNNPLVAGGMNRAEKIVFSKKMKEAEWGPARIISGNVEEEIKKLKQESAKDMTVLGSGSIAKLLAEKGLIDEYQVMVHPVAISNGTPFLEGIKNKLELELTHTKDFESGVVLHVYRPAVK